MDLAVPVSGISKTNIKISCNSRNPFFISQRLSFASRTRGRNHNHSYRSHERSVLKIYSSKSDVRNAVVRTSQDEKEACSETENKIVPFSPRGQRFKEEFLSKIVPWEKIPVSFDNFPYYIDENSKALLMECVASHLKWKKVREYGGVLKYSSNRIQLQSLPGTDLYRERLVSAVARELQVPLLKLDSSVLPPYDIGQQEAQHNSITLEYEEDSFYRWDSDSSDEDESSYGEGYTSAIPDGVRQLQKGDRVQYVGDSTSLEEVKNRTLSKGDRGEVHEVNGDKVAVIFNDCGLKRKEADEVVEEKEKNTETTAQILTWLDAKNVKHEDNAQIHDCFLALEFLYEVLESRQPIIVYFPDSFFSSLITSGSDCHYFVEKAKKMLDKLSTGHVVLICGQNEREVGSEDIEKFPDSLKQYINTLKDATLHEYHVNELFTNAICIKPPKNGDLEKFIKQIEEDRTTVISQANSSAIHKVLKSHKLLCMDLEKANIKDMILKRAEVQKIVSWATNHYLSSCSHPCVKEDLLHIPYESLKLAITRFEAEKNVFSSKNSPRERIKALADGKHERELASAVVCPEEIGVKFDDVGALEHVKKTLYETVILPLKRPELFSHGNLLKPCKGILLFGPPGTGKTLMAKALATESGANFINVTSATITSMWWGETENLTRALFSYASKLAPVIIFIDEVDSLLGARGHSISKHDTSRLNEFMAAWDGLNSKEKQRILVIGATNRPYDLDEAVIRRMPRRIYVGLPDVENRCKILKIHLNKENLESGFSFEQVAEGTDGYSGSDLKNLCVAAAYRPLEEFLEQESKLQGEASDGVPVLRPLNVNDFIHSKAKVRASVAENASSILKLRKWKEKYGEGEESQAQNSMDGNVKCGL